MIFLCVVVWICHDQATITVPQALEHLSTVMPQEEENLTLCKIPTDAPFWPSLPSEDESYLAMLSGDGTENLFGGPPQAFLIYQGITYHWALSFQIFMALNKEISGKADIQSDEAAFYYIKPREVLWINDLYTTVGDNNQSIPAVKPLYLVGPHSILPNPLLEFNPTIAAAASAASEEEPRAEAKAVEVGKHIVMVGKKQFDMTMGGDQESDSTSSLTAIITHVKLEPPNKNTIHKDADDSLLQEGTEDIADEVALENTTTADEVETTLVTNNTPALHPQLQWSPMLRPLCTGPPMWW